MKRAKTYLTLRPNRIIPNQVADCPWRFGKLPCPEAQTKEL